MGNEPQHKANIFSVRQGATVLGDYGYDYQGLRTSKTDATSTRRYTYDEQSVLLQSDTNGQTLATYRYGPDQLLSLDHTTEGQQYYLFDGLGSVVNLTKPDGSLQARYQYDAWGNTRVQTGTSANPFGFTGHEKDEESGLYYFKARYYDASLGRFLSQDSYLGETNTPPSLHRYLYAYANPTVYVDLNGNEAIDFASGVATSVVNSLFGGNLDPYEEQGLSQEQKEYNKNRSYSDGRLQKQYKVDLREMKIDKEIVVGPSLGEQIKTTLTLGIPETGEAIGTAVGAIAVSTDESYSKEVRDQADYDAGSAAAPALFTAVARKGSKAKITKDASSHPGVQKTSVDKKWKEKFEIDAKAQSTPGYGDKRHAVRSYKEAIKLAKDPNVEKVYLDKGYNKSLGLPAKTIQPNGRPDVTAVYKNKDVARVEVVSKTDKVSNLRNRNTAVDDQIRDQGYNPLPPKIIVPTKKEK